MKRLTSTRRPWWLAGALLLTFGCGIGQSPPTSDATKAEQILNNVLDAWKGGEKPDALAQRTPPIHVADVEWKDGFRLISYRPVGEGRLVGFDMSYPVALELKAPNGAILKKDAVYVVTTQPKVLVLRQEG
jgi:hypothetical protein